ncbi:hypothetical protein D3C77_751680 [compost metagenome]
MGRTLMLAVVELAEQIDFFLGFPGNAFAAVAKFIEQGADGAEALVGLGVVALDLDE